MAGSGLAEGQSNFGYQPGGLRRTRSGIGVVLQLPVRLCSVNVDGNNRGVQRKQGGEQLAVGLGKSNQPANGGGVAQVLRAFKAGGIRQDAGGQICALRMFDQFSKGCHGADTQTGIDVPDVGQFQGGQVDNAVDVAPLPRFQSTHQMGASGQGQAPCGSISQQIEGVCQ